MSEPDHGLSEARSAAGGWLRGMVAGVSRVARMGRGRRQGPGRSAAGLLGRGAAVGAPVVAISTAIFWLLPGNGAVREQSASAAAGLPVGAAPSIQAEQDAALLESWEGMVDVGAFIPVRAGRSMELRVEQAHGRGTVRVARHPRAENGFVGLVHVADKGRGADRYGFRAYGRAVAEAPPARPAADLAFEWEGVVDRRAEIVIRQGEPTSAANTKFTVCAHRGQADLFRGASLRLEQKSGRGKAELVQQPCAANDYTARVAISDAGGGPDLYRFALYAVQH